MGYGGAGLGQPRSMTADEKRRLQEAYGTTPEGLAQGAERAKAVYAKPPPLIAGMRAMPAGAGGAGGPGESLLAAPDLTDEALVRARRAQVLRLLSGRGRRSTFLTMPQAQAQAPGLASVLGRGL